jgi:hypothetical protein
MAVEAAREKNDASAAAHAVDWCGDRHPLTKAPANVAPAAGAHEIVTNKDGQQKSVLAVTTLCPWPAMKMSSTSCFRI